MNIQRLRNLTTGRLHTQMGHIYEDLEFITGQSLMTHMLPRALKSCKPWLRENVTEPRFWDDKYDITHIGEFELRPPTLEEQSEMFDLYSKMENPLANKEVIAINIQQLTRNNYEQRKIQIFKSVSKHSFKMS